MDIYRLRKEYLLKSLRRSDLHINPFDQFKQWLKEAVESQVDELNAMCLATADRQGCPSSRYVLLKHFDERGFTFFTGKRSRKSLSLFANPNASLTFFWKELERQIHIEGVASELDRKEVESYFHLRPRASQLAAWASLQDGVLSSREELEEAYSYWESEFEGKEVSTPPEWTGFRIFPSRYEFWQGRQNRLHDRFLYRWEEAMQEWIIERLSP